VDVRQALRPREDDVLRAEADAIAVTERQAHSGLHPDPVQERAVEAAAVLEEPAPLRLDDEGGGPRHGGLVEREVVLLGPPDRSLLPQLQLGPVAEDERCPTRHVPILSMAAEVPPVARSAPR